MLRMDVSHGAPVMRGSSLMALKPLLAEQVAETLVHALAVWFIVMLQTFCVPLVIFHTILPNTLALSHVHITTPLGEQKLSHARNVLRE